MRRAGIRRLWITIPVAFAVGCAARHELPAPCVAEDAAPQTESVAPELSSTLVESSASPNPPDVSTDPIAYLRFVREKCRELSQYTLTLTREDRRGLGIFRRLRPPERIACWFRRSPFSVRMKWLDPEIKYGESTYVEGQERNRVRFTPRFGILGLKPGVVRIDPMTSVVWGESRGPVTDFGIERLIDKTFVAYEDASNSAIVEYLGVTKPTGLASPAHHIRLRYEGTDYTTPVQDLYIDPVRHLPVATELWLASGELDARYLYEALDPQVSLTDDDFLIEAERAGKLAGAGD